MKGNRILFHIGAIDEEARIICQKSTPIGGGVNPCLPNISTAAVLCNENVPPICATGETQGTR